MRGYISQPTKKNKIELRSADGPININRKPLPGEDSDGPVRGRYHKEEGKKGTKKKERRHAITINKMVLRANAWQT